MGYQISLMMEGWNRIKLNFSTQRLGSTCHKLKCSFQQFYAENNDFCRPIQCSCLHFHFKSLWVFLYDCKRNTIQISFYRAARLFPLNLMLSAVEGGPLFTQQRIDFWFSCGAHIAVMFYSGAIQRAAEIMTLFSLLSDRADAKHRQPPFSWL